MIDSNNSKRRAYIYYILGILLSATILTIDIFSEKSLSKYLNEKLSFLSPIPISNNIDFNFSSFKIFETKSRLINENIRLKNEVIELRKLKIENEKLKSEIKANNSIIKEVDVAIYDIFKTSIIFKTIADEYIISGGENLNLKEKDLIIDKNSYVVGIVTKVNKDRSIISTILNPNFSIEGIDKYGNNYLITSDSQNLFINSQSLEADSTDIKYIYTDIAFGHPGQLPIVDLTSTKVNFANSKIRAEHSINFKINYFTDLYLIKTK